MTTTYIDYMEKIRVLYYVDHIENPEKPITEEIAFYDWCVEMEDAYRVANYLTKKDCISLQKLYEFVLKRVQL